MQDPEIIQSATSTLGAFWGNIIAVCIAVGSIIGIIRFMLLPRLSAMEAQVKIIKAEQEIIKSEQKLLTQRINQIEEKSKVQEEKLEKIFEAFKNEMKIQLGHFKELFETKLENIKG